MSGAGVHGGRGADTTAHTLSLRGPALGSHTLGSHVSPPLKACDLEQGTSFLRASVSSSEVGSWQDGVMWCRVLTGVVPRAWPELSSWSPGTTLTPFALVSDFRTQDAPRPYVTKVNVRQVETSRPGVSGYRWGGSQCCYLAQPHLGSSALVLGNCHAKA